MVILSLILSLSLFAGEKFETFKGELASPITTDASSITLAGTVSTLLVYSSQSNKKFQKRESFNDARPLGEFGYFGDLLGYGILNGGYAIGHYWYGKAQDDPVSVQNANIMLKATTYSLGWATALKYLVQEKRPGYPDDKTSFPSGHATGSFAFATVVAAQHDWVWGMLAYGVASYISISRVNDDWHYLHDILAGATIGAGYGYGLSSYYKNKTEQKMWFSLLPTEGDGLGLSVGHIW